MQSYGGGEGHFQTPLRAIKEAITTAQHEMMTVSMTTSSHVLKYLHCLMPFTSS